MSEDIAAHLSHEDDDNYDDIDVENDIEEQKDSVGEIYGGGRLVK